MQKTINKFFTKQPGVTYTVSVIKHGQSPVYVGPFDTAYDARVWSNEQRYAPDAKYEIQAATMAIQTVVDKELYAKGEDSGTAVEKTT